MRVAIGLSWPVRKSLAAKEQETLLLQAINAISGTLVGDLSAVASVVDTTLTDLAQIRGIVGEDVCVSDRRPLRI